METYGTTVDEVLSLLPHLDLTEGDTEVDEIGGEGRLTIVDVQRFINLMGAWVRQRIGPLPVEDPDNAGAENPAYAAARTVTVYGAAVWAESGSFPERADTSDTTYAGLLYKFFTESLNELLESLGIGTGSGEATSPIVGKPAAVFPAPIFVRDQGF